MRCLGRRCRPSLVVQCRRHGSQVKDVSPHWRQVQLAGWSKNDVGLLSAAPGAGLAPGCALCRAWAAEDEGGPSLIDFGLVFARRHFHFHFHFSWSAATQLGESKAKWVMNTVTMTMMMMVVVIMMMMMMTITTMAAVNGGF